MSTAKIELPIDAIRDFCRKQNIHRLAVFGSVLRDDFRPESDADLLVQFEPDERVGLFRLLRTEEELSKMLGPKVDLSTKGMLSPYFLDEVLETAETIVEVSVPAA